MAPRNAPKTPAALRSDQRTDLVAVTAHYEKAVAAARAQFDRDTKGPKAKRDKAIAQAQTDYDASVATILARGTGSDA